MLMIVFKAFFTLCEEYLQLIFRIKGRIYEGIILLFWFLKDKTHSPSFV